MTLLRKIHTRDELFGFQRAAVQFIKDTKRCALFIEMGLGKTVSVLTAIRDLQLQLDLARVLVIGPPRVARSVWPDEIKSWEHTRDIAYTSLLVPGKKRLSNMHEATDIHFISQDLVPWLDIETCGIHDYDMIVVDESSGFKSQDAKRWKALRRLVANTPYVVLLTGTPAPNGLQDLWGQMFLLDGGARLGTTESAFRKRYFSQGWGEHAKPEAKSFAERKIRERIEDICFTLLEEDYSELPPRINNPIRVELEPAVMKQYKQLVREFALELPEGQQVTAVSAAALTQKVQQAANGLVYDADRQAHRLHTHKLDALQEVITEANGEPVIVAYSHKACRDAILKKFPQAVLLGNNPKTLEDWNAGRIPILVVHPKSAGHGLNMQFGGHILVWYGLTWSLELYQQLNKRLHRKGQVNTVTVHHIIATGTIDEAIMDSLLEKDQTQSSFMGALRRIIIDEIRRAA